MTHLLLGYYMSGCNRIQGFMGHKCNGHYTPLGMVYLLPAQDRYLLASLYYYFCPDDRFLVCQMFLAAATVRVLEDPFRFKNLQCYLSYLKIIFKSRNVEHLLPLTLTIWTQTMVPLSRAV